LEPRPRFKQGAERVDESTPSRPEKMSFAIIRQYAVLWGNMNGAGQGRFEDLDSLVRFVDELALFHFWSDVNRGRQEAGRSGEQYHRRQYIRAFFAWIEGTCFGLKQLALLSRNVQFSDAERSLLAEKSYTLTDAGGVATNAAHIKTEQNIKFAFAMYAKSAGLEYALPVREEGWACLKKSLRVRDRLTHPKLKTDLSVSDEDFANAELAHDWLNATWHELRERTIDKIMYDQGLSAEDMRKFREYRRRLDGR